jgi:alpha-tubulin suppressor-like RCC1 family protein
LGDVNHRGKEANEMGDSLPVVSLNALATSVRAGLQHSCAILVGGDIKCWGRSFFGQLGLGDNISRGNDPNEMGANLTTTNLGTGLTTKFLAVGYYHTCAGLNDSTVKCCGYNGSGRLGLGDSTSRGTASSHMGDNLPRVALRTGRTAKALTSHGDHTCVLLDNNSVKCWGSNGFGQLGVGSTGDRGDAANEMGDNLPVVELVGP